MVGGSHALTRQHTKAGDRKDDRKNVECLLRKNAAGWNMETGHRTYFWKSINYFLLVLAKTNQPPRMDGALFWQD